VGHWVAAESIPEPPPQFQVGWHIGATVGQCVAAEYIVCAWAGCMGQCGGADSRWGGHWGGVVGGHMAPTEGQMVASDSVGAWAWAPPLGWHWGHCVGV